MQLIPADILEQYSAVLKKRADPALRHADYRKWLRYYVDFRGKYTLPAKIDLSHYSLTHHVVCRGRFRTCPYMERL